MSVNKFKKHILVVCEDAKNREIVNGFLLHPSIQSRAIQVLPEVGGWRKVVESFEQVHSAEMNRYPNRYVVLILDFDNDLERRQRIQQAIPDHLSDRVAIFGSAGEPEDFSKQRIGTTENVGRGLADDCFDGNRLVWNDDLLCHNLPEIDRVGGTLKTILFD